MVDDWREINIKLFPENVTDYIYNSFHSKERAEGFLGEV
jgi:hypothetical protein